ncbi:MAG: pyridoxal-dependent decarboxylase, partial [Mycobacteriaceae bacterium]
HAAAHLQPAPLAVAVAADALASATNASLDTYDSGPATLAVERWAIRQLATLAGLGPCAGGVLTPGGSLSTLLGLLLARDAAGDQFGVDVRTDGVAALGTPVVVASELAHFSVLRACSALGLGERAVLSVPVDARRRMEANALRRSLDALPADAVPIAVVATAGTTDFGSVDPLRELAAIATEYGTWLHVDAAYGFGALFTPQLAHLLDGIELADSVTADLHKLGWQPAAASALLVADPARFAPLHREVAYLTAADTRGGRVALELAHADSGTTVRSEVDVVVAATGYAPRRFPSGVEALLQRDENGQLVVYADHSLRTRDDVPGLVFLSGTEHASHGAAAPDLGFGAVRNATILNVVAGREVRRLPKHTAFSTFTGAR